MFISFFFFKKKASIIKLLFRIKYHSLTLIELTNSFNVEFFFIQLWNLLPNLIIHILKSYLSFNKRLWILILIKKIMCIIYIKIYFEPFLKEK